MLRLVTNRHFVTYYLVALTELMTQVCIMMSLVTCIADNIPYNSFYIYKVSI